MLLRYHFSLVLSSQHHEARTTKTNQRTKKEDEHEKEEDDCFCFFFFFWAYLLFMIPHPCLDTLSPLPSFTSLGYPFFSDYQYLDSDSALTPSLGRRVGTEYLNPEKKGRRRQCFYAIANAGSRGRFCFFVLTVFGFGIPFGIPIYIMYLSVSNGDGGKEKGYKAVGLPVYVWDSRSFARC